MNTKKHLTNSGFSIIEVMLAVSLFVIFVSGMATVALRGMDNNRTAQEQVIANQFASEGLEAVRSIRNQDYSYLVKSAGTGVVRSGGGVWAFSGANNVFEKYTRVLSVAAVNRDGNGDVVASGGTADPDTKKITSTVTWAVGSARTNSVVLTTYLTDWPSPVGGGPTPTPTPSVSPTPVPASCTDVCVNNGFTSGTCRGNVGECVTNGETNIPAGNSFCTGGINADTCCCL